eukprot:CAMPEP_0172662810 /NCGR_PEP_ID=MMETSP1074-20121228/5560_1 /TAXON_ID=2916 /ORGANISM="Ceratium fusus, Strain PA161109" /LENGTH=451 /DNA_ID=CAMNT_0013478745 /DNA_START=42 /DNA_END=1398 /DNA_ORIENTATION=-
MMLETNGVANAALDRVAVEVRTVGGTLLAELTVHPEETVGLLKQRVLVGIQDAELRACCRQPVLVAGNKPLPDGHRFIDCLGGPAGLAQAASASVGGPLVLCLVSMQRSRLADKLEQFERSGGDVAGAVDVADAVFQAEHEASLRHRPQAINVTTAMPQEKRAQVVAWLGMACEAMLLDDALLHGAVLTLDRYLSACRETLNESQLLQLSLAALCTEMKLANEDNFPPGHWQRVLARLSQGRLLLSGVFEAEAAMLRQLGFVLFIPTVLTFLSGLSLRFVGKPQDPMETPMQDGRPGPSTPGMALHVVLARLLAELVLYDAELQYRHAPAILAGATLGTALLCCGPIASHETVAAEADNPDSDGSTLEAQHGLLLQDLASYCPGTCGLDGMVRTAELDILHFWLECSQAKVQWANAMPTCGGDIRDYAMSNNLAWVTQARDSWKMPHQRTV